MGSLTCFQTFSQPLPCVSILPRGRSVLQVLDTTPLYTLLWAAQPYKMGTTWYTKLDHIFFGVCGCLSVYLVTMNHHPVKGTSNESPTHLNFPFHFQNTIHCALPANTVITCHHPGKEWCISLTRTHSKYDFLTFATCLQPFWDLWGAFFWNLSGIMMVIS